MLPQHLFTLPFVMPLTFTTPYRFGVKIQPLYINVIRKPLDRLVSHYYFIRYGDDLRPQRVLKKMGDRMVRNEKERERGEKGRKNNQKELENLDEK